MDHLLVVTFTKAAAGEMKERIMAALDEKVREFPGNQHFVKQLSMICWKKLMRKKKKILSI